MRVAIGLLAQDNPVNQKRWVKRSHPSGSREQKQEERAEAGRESGSRKRERKPEERAEAGSSKWKLRAMSVVCSPFGLSDLGLHHFFTALFLIIYKRLST